MRVLIVSHNVFCKSTNMGKTLLSYFEHFEKNELAQFYIHSEVPQESLCEKYYRITDKDALKSIFTRKSGRVFGKDDVGDKYCLTRAEGGFTANIYQRARRRTPITYLVRNLWWQLGAWKTKKLKKWISDINPDVVFFASGDYAFMYKIALWMSRYCSIPLVVSCVDDYYFHNKNEKSFIGRFVHKRFMKQVHRTISHASCIYAICDSMSSEYGAYFGKPCFTLHTPATITKPFAKNKSNAISYIGNLSYGRNEQLVKLGKTLKNVSSKEKPKYIDVYSAETRPEILAELVEENGIKFHGVVSAEKVLEIMAKSLAVIHTESFDERYRKQVKYSVSTKIADSLASGTCILAYGPKEVASMQYLLKNEAAYCITEFDDVCEKLGVFLSDEQLRTHIEHNAVSLAQKNHHYSNNSKMLNETMERICFQ